MNQQRIDKLREQIAPLQNEIWELEHEARMTDLRSLVGKCFVYSNSYSGDQRWPLYQKVVAVGDRLYVARAQNDLRGQVEIECKELHSYSSGESLGQEISESEYNDGVRSCMEWAQRFLNGEPYPNNESV